MVKDKSRKKMYSSKEELWHIKHEQMRETFSKVDPEQLRKFINREI